jgi:hypothetical protein
MNDMEKKSAMKGGKKKMSGWLIALIVIAALFITGALFFDKISAACYAAGKTQEPAVNPAQVTTQIDK